MIYDCFPFFNELDVLEIRLEELYPVVDKFVIVESNTTFRGHPKPFYFSDNFERYERFSDKVINVQYKDEVYHGENDSPLTPWSREEYQRNQIGLGLENCEPDDIIIISDCDEMPRRSAVVNTNPEQITDLRLDVYCYQVNMRTNSRHTIKMLKYRDFTNAQEIRKKPPEVVVEDAGWEFSSMGTPEQISHKLKNFSHWELDVEEFTNPEKIRERMLQGLDLTGTACDLQVVEIDDSFPEAIKNNREKFGHLEW